MKRTSPYLPAAASLWITALAGCMTSAPIQRYSPSFAYAPPNEVKPGAANVTFAVVGASYPALIPLFQRFDEHLSQDFFGILTARGYTVRGPFRTYDDMTFPDKKGSDLTLIPELQINGDDSGLKWEQSLGAAILGAKGVTAKGTLVITGRINLVVAESLSREKMWTKSVDIPPISVTVEDTHLYPNPVETQVLLEREDGIYNDVAKALETQYKAILDRAYQYLDPDEMLIVKKQAQDIRNRKVY